MTEQTPMERLAENAEMNPIGLGHHGLCIVLKADVRSVLSDLTRLTAENERLRGALTQAGGELQEAANCLRPYLPRLATIYVAAAGSATQAALSARPAPGGEGV